jgi:hypothetical protein
MVPGAGRHHPGRPLGRIEPGDPVVGAPDLERPGPLEMLGFEQDGPAGQDGEVLRALHRGAADDRSQEAPGRLDVVEGDERRHRGSQEADPTVGIVGRSLLRTPSAPIPPSAWR